MRPPPPLTSLAIDGGRDQLHSKAVEKSLSVVNLADVRKEVECPICLGIIRKTRAVMECMHRFCRECIEKSMRFGNNECPACRIHCSSRRSLRKDPNFDALIAIFFPDIDKYEEEELDIPKDITESLKRMRIAYSMTLIRQTAALGKKRTATAFMKRSKVKYLRSSNLIRRKRNLRNVAEIPGPSGNGGMSFSPIAEGTERETISKNDKSRAEAQRPKHIDTNVIVIADASDQGNIPEHEPMRDMISSSTTLAWGKNGQRSNSRNNAKNAIAARNNRLSRLIDHFRSSEQNDDELDIFIKLVSFEERRVANLPRPYLSCRPTLSIKQLRQYVAYQTSLQTEEIELYLVKESQADLPSGDAKLDPDNDKSQFLTREEETLAELKTYNVNCGYLVIAYKRKMWNLNIVMSE